ncbi:myosin-4 [Capsicum annuum]
MNFVLRDAICDQIRASRRSLGEQDASENSKAIGISRPRFVDQHVRQQRALQQLGMMQPHAWRPQRGLPETFVSVLRSWLSEYFLHSGVSGSGKTKTAKFAIGYLVMISGGNNKERLTEIYFSAEGGIAVLTNKHSRVVQLARGERSCHIFYHLCPGAPSALRDKLKLKGASEYNFLNQTESLVIHNVDDAKKFHMLVKALNTLGISERDQEYAFQMVAALLWLGNITFQAIGNRNNVEVVQSEEEKR